MECLRVGIIGCGVIAPTHADALRQQPDVQLAWACDLIEDKARALADRYGIESVADDARRVLDDPSVNAVCICTDHASHADLVCDALEAGKHVLCEKALAATSEGLDRMVRAHARREELVFSGVFQHRFNRVYQLLRRRVEAGDFGTMLTAGVRMHCKRTDGYYQADAWRGTWAGEGGSVLINQAIHFVDILAWMLGGVDAVAAALDNRTHGLSIETEDTAAAAVRFSCGAMGTIEATCSSHLGWSPSVWIHGSAGLVRVDDGIPVEVRFADEALQAEIHDELTACDGEGTVREGKTYYGGQHISQIADFVDAIRTRRPPTVTGESARHAVDVVLAVYRAHRGGGWAEVASCPHDAREDDLPAARAAGGA
jgi:predicted dehydrogenase